MSTYANRDHPELSSNSPPEPSGRDIATFDRPGRGRGPDTELRVTLDEYLGHPYISLRVWSKGADGRWYPTRKGVSVKIREASNLAATLVEAAGLVELGHEQPTPTTRRDDRHRGPGTSPSRHRPAGQVPARKEVSASSFDPHFDEFDHS